MGFDTEKNQKVELKPPEEEVLDYQLYYITFNGISELDIQYNNWLQIQQDRNNFNKYLEYKIKMLVDEEEKEKAFFATLQKPFPAELAKIKSSVR